MNRAMVCVLAAGALGALSLSASAQSLPDGCRAGSADGGHGPPGMPGMMPGGSMPGLPMPPGMPGLPGLSEAQKAYLGAVMSMHGPMMAGIMAKDPDVAFVCGMIAHHQGAIAMARVELKHGSNAEAKGLAERIVRDQGKEIEEMTAWLTKNAKSP